MSESVAPTKSSIARQILSEIGALAQNPPEGWRAKAEDELPIRINQKKLNPINNYKFQCKICKQSKSC